MSEAVDMGKIANAGMARDDSSTATRLLDKNWSPLIVRKYQMEGWPMYIGIICDANLNDLDDVVYDPNEEEIVAGVALTHHSDFINYAWVPQSMFDDLDETRLSIINGTIVVSDTYP